MEENFPAKHRETGLVPSYGSLSLKKDTQSPVNATTQRWPAPK